MATTVYFQEIIRDQGGRDQMDVELGRSSFYAGAEVSSGIGDDSIYLKIDGKNVIMDLGTAKKFVSAVISVGRNHRLID